MSSTSRTFIGIDIGGTNLRLALVDGEGKILYQERQATRIELGWGSFFDRLSAAVETLRGEAAVRGLEVCALGAGVPGLISPEGFIHSSVNLTPLEGLNLPDMLSSMIDLPVAVANDANAFALGEMAFGAGKGMRSFILLTIGTGVGSGLILDGRIWTGPDGSAGEYGHATVEPEGRLCACGNHGCLEQYSSATAIVRAVTAALDRGAGGLLAGLPRTVISAQSIAEAARAGDAIASSVFADAGRYLGIAAATAANLLNLEGVIISGGVAASFDLLEGPIRRELLMRAFSLNAERMKVLKGTLGDDAGILGSAALAMGLCPP